MLNNAIAQLDGLQVLAKIGPPCSSQVTCPWQSPDSDLRFFRTSHDRFHHPQGFQVASKDFLVDLDQIDFDNPIAEIDDIRDFNAQRHEMEQLSAVVYEDIEQKICVGYLDVTDHEFWVKGHMPGLPLMPGVIMLEAVAQLCSYFVQKNQLLDSSILGFGGVDQVRFRDVVLPGQRLVLLAKLTRVRPNRMMTCEFQGVVERKIVVDGTLKGIPLPVEQLKTMNNSKSSSTGSVPSDLAN